MAFKAAVETIIGKTVKHVVVKEGATPPQSQVFLVFTDDTYYEFYATYGTISGAGAIDTGGVEAVRRYMGGEKRVVYER